VDLNTAGGPRNLTKFPQLSRFGCASSLTHLLDAAQPSSSVNTPSCPRQPADHPLAVATLKSGITVALPLIILHPSIAS